uniref:YebC/PmpR family DNA-binding transcriptional regulator n=1 Tax=Heterorhabditis bacteriophora TaxID=37862 RepID=A0A1I7XSZ6_HETBA
MIGPSGTFFIVQTETDNKKAIENTLRKYMNKVGGFRLASDSSAVRSWFREKGVLTVATQRQGTEVKLEQIEEAGIELDCEEVSLVEENGNKFELVCDPSKVATVEGELVKLGFVIFIIVKFLALNSLFRFIVESSEVHFRALHFVTVQGEEMLRIEKLYELLQDDESIRQIYDNIDLGK